MIALSSTLAKCDYRRRWMRLPVRRAEICCVNQTLPRPTGGVHISQRSCSCMKAPRRGLSGGSYTYSRRKTKEVLNVDGIPTTDITQTTLVVRKLKDSSLLCNHELQVNWTGVLQFQIRMNIWKSAFRPHLCLPRCVFQLIFRIFCMYTYVSHSIRSYVSLFH
jgi:hypothetical protein